jgi:hypothetical protein
VSDRVLGSGGGEPGIDGVPCSRGAVAAASKAGKNTGLSQKNSFFCEKTGPMFSGFFSALFARAMCGAGKGVLGEFLRLQRGVPPIFFGISTTSFMCSESIRPIVNNF